MTMLKTLLTMTVLGSLMGLMVLLLGWITRRWRLHRAVQVWLWALVALRLVCPFGLNASFGLSHAPIRIYDGLLGAQTVTLPENAGVQQSAQQDTLQSSPSGGGLQYGVGQPATAPELVHSTTQTVTIRPYVSPEKSNLLLWIWGMVALAFGLWGVLSYVLFRRRLRHCRWLDVRLEESERVAVPCVVGVFHPRVYLPAGLTPEQQHHTVTHERCHIRRGDHIWKILAYGILALHWFNPLVWLFYFKFQRDVEMACDELVLRKLGNGARSDYSQTLLDLAKPRPGGLTTPVAFSENSIKSRLVRILKVSHPRLAVTIPVALVCVVLTLSVVVGAAEEKTVLNINEDGTVTVYLPTERISIDEEGNHLKGEGKDILTYGEDGRPKEWKHYTYTGGFVSNGFQYFYDQSGNLLELKSPRGLDSATYWETYEYNQQGQLVTYQVFYQPPFETLETDPLLERLSYTYDAQGRLATFVYYNPAWMGADVRGEYRYSADGRQVEIIQYLDGELNTYSVNRYNEQGKMAQSLQYKIVDGVRTDEVNYCEDLFYDEDGNHIRTTISDYTFSPLVEYAEKEVIYTYDEYGNCTSYRFYQNDSGTRTFIEGYEYVITPVDVTPEAALRLMECRPQTPFWLST